MVGFPSVPLRLNTTSLSTQTRTLEPHSLDQNFLSESSTWHLLGRSHICPVNVVDIHPFPSMQGSSDLCISSLPDQRSGVGSGMAIFLRSLNLCFPFTPFTHESENTKSNDVTCNARTLIPKSSPSPSLHSPLHTTHHPVVTQESRYPTTHLLSWVNFSVIPGDAAPRNQIM